MIRGLKFTVEAESAELQDMINLFAALNKIDQGKENRSVQIEEPAAPEAPEPPKPKATKPKAKRKAAEKTPEPEAPTQPAPEPAPAAQPEAGTGTITIDDVRREFTEAVTSHPAARQKIAEIIAAAGARNLTTLPEDKYEWALNELRGWLQEQTA